MELGDFISSTIVGIIKGVTDAQRLSGEYGAEVISTSYESEAAGAMGGTQKVLFDVAVSASDSTSKGGEGGIQVWAIGFGGKVSSSGENSTVSRIRFEVDINLPAHSKTTGQNLGTDWD